MPRTVTGFRLSSTAVGRAEYVRFLQKQHRGRAGAGTAFEASEALVSTKRKREKRLRVDAKAIWVVRAQENEYHSRAQPKVIACTAWLS